MGRGGRQGGQSGGGMRGYEDSVFADMAQLEDQVTESIVGPSVYNHAALDRCQTEPQRQLLASLQEKSSGEYLQASVLQDALQAPPEDFQRVCAELEGVGRDALSAPVVDIIRDSGGSVSSLRALSEQEYDQGRFARDNTPATYGNILRQVQTRNRAALEAARSSEERKIIQGMVDRSRMNAGDPDNFWSRSEVILESKVMKHEADKALGELLERGVLTETSTPEGNKYSLAPYSDSRYLQSEVGKHAAYKEQFGEEKYAERMRHVSEKMDRAWDLVQGPEEEALLTYIQRDNPYLNDEANIVSWREAANAMRPLMSSAEFGQKLDSMTARGIFAQRDKRDGAGFVVSDDLVRPMSPLDAR